MSRLGEGLDRLVPAFGDDGGGDWDDVVARSGGRHRRRVILGLAGVAVAALLATPAFGLRGLVADLLGRKDVPFTGQTAPTEVKAEFYDLGLGGPGFPGAIASQTRKVATVRVQGTRHVLWVSPTRRGGYCWQFSGWFGGCRPVRTLPKTPVRGRVVPALLGVTYGMRTRHGVDSVSRIGGDVLARAARKLQLRYADGSTTDVPFYFVSAPIDAGFFLAAVPASHATVATRPVSVDLYDDGGHLLARQTFRYETAAQRAKALAQRRAMTRRMRRMRGSHGAYVPDPPPTAGTPKPALQHGSADGVTVVVGGNGVIVFDLTGATPAARDRIGTRGVSYGCVKRLPYHAEPVSLGNFYGWTTGRAVIRRSGQFAPPFQACEIQGGYGHTWPDRNHSHSAVEIPLTPAGRRFFEDRATARDLAAFIRSQPLRRIRRAGGHGDDLERALRSSRYGGSVTRISAVGAALPVHRIGYVLRGDDAVFVEHSATGRRFQVRIVDGRVRSQNLNHLASAM